MVVHCEDCFREVTSERYLKQHKRYCKGVKNQQTLNINIKSLNPQKESNISESECESDIDSEIELENSVRREIIAMSNPSSSSSSNTFSNNQSTSSFIMSRQETPLNHNSSNQNPPTSNVVLHNSNSNVTLHNSQNPNVLLQNTLNSNALLQTSLISNSLLQNNSNIQQPNNPNVNNNQQPTNNNQQLINNNQQPINLSINNQQPNNFINSNQQQPINANHNMQQQGISNHNNIALISNSINNINENQNFKWVEKIISSFRGQNAIFTLNEVLDLAPDMTTFSEVVLNIPRKQVLSKVNEYIQIIERSETSQNETYNNLLKKLSPELQNLVSTTKKAFLAGLRDSKKAEKQKTTVESWEKHGINQILQPIKQLQDAVRKYAHNDDKTFLDDTVNSMHKLIAESTLKARLESPLLEVRNCVMIRLSDVFSKLENLVAGQINARQILESFISLVDVALILGMTKAISRNKSQSNTDNNQQQQQQPQQSSDIQPAQNNSPQLTSEAVISQIISTLSERFLPSLIEQAVSKVMNPNGAQSVQSPVQTGPQQRNSSGHQRRNFDNTARTNRNSDRTYVSDVRQENSSRQSTNPHHHHQNQRQQYTTSQNWRSQNQHYNYYQRDWNSQFDQNHWRPANYRKRFRKPFGGQQSRNSSTNHQSTTPSFQNQSPNGSPIQN